MATGKEMADTSVYHSKRAGECSQCGAAFSDGDLITLEPGKILCLACSGLTGLEYLSSGDAALTRRAVTYTGRRILVYRFSSSRKRWERKGVLVAGEALGKARIECDADAEQRKSQRAVAAKRRSIQDARYIEAFSLKIRDMFPNAPAGIEGKIAEHACEKHSGRVGRSSQAKSLSAAAVSLAVRAHIRHGHTRYDDLLSQGYPRDLAREQVASEIDRIVTLWISAGR
jgi:hypothetical protein